MKSLYHSALGLSIISLIACGEKAPELIEKKVVDVIKVKTLTLTPQTFSENLKLHGVVKAKSLAQLISYDNGEVGKINVKEGQRVKTGQYLCNIDADIQSVKLEAAKIQKELTESNLNSIQRQNEVGLSSDVELSKAKMEKAQATQAYLTMKKVWRGSVCLAPFSGTVAKIHVESYQNIPAGSPTISLLNDSKIEVEFGVPESEYAFFKKGKNIRVESSFDNKQYDEANLSELAGVLTRDERNYTATVELDNKKGYWNQGQSVNVLVNGLEVENAMVVPTTAILPRVGDDEVALAVEGKAKVIKVKTIASNEKYTLVEGDLTLGSKLIVEGHSRVIDGGMIKILGEVAK